MLFVPLAKIPSPSLHPSTSVHGDSEIHYQEVQYAVFTTVTEIPIEVTMFVLESTTTVGTW